MKTAIHIEITSEQLDELRRTARHNRRVLLIVDANAVAVSNHHSEAWLKARQLACIRCTDNINK